MERETRIGLASPAWKAGALPLSYSRKTSYYSARRLAVSSPSREKACDELLTAILYTLGRVSQPGAWRARRNDFEQGLALSMRDILDCPLRPLWRL